MKHIITVQEAFKQTKAKKLAKMYLEEHISKEEVGKHGTKKTIKALKQYIKFLRKITPKATDNSKTYVFYVSHRLSNDGLIPEPYFNYQRIGELGSSFSSYAYEFTPFEEILSCPIILTWKTKYYLDELLVDIMHEMSWFGYRQENLKKEKKKLDKAIKESEEGNVESFVINNRKDLYDMFDTDITDSDHFDKYEYLLQHKLITKQNALTRHSIDREAIKVKKILAQNNLN